MCLSVVGAIFAVCVLSALSGHDRIPAAAVRALLDGYAGSKLVYLSVSDVPASQRLVDRLSDLKLRIVPARDTTLVDGSIVDAVTKQPVIVCEIESVRWTSPFTATVKASSYEGPMGGSGAEYDLFGTPFGWSVVSVRNQWVS